MADKPWYHNGLRFRCTGCGECCTGDPGYVWVNRAEIELLARDIGMDVAEFEREYVRQVGVRRSLVEYPNGDCVFFDRETRHCAVYRRRPRQCRTWPFWQTNVSTPQAWEAASLTCPGCGQGRILSADEIEASRRLIRI